MKIFWSKKALNRLEKLQKFYVELYGSETANLILNQIVEKPEILEDFPELGQIEQNNILEGKELRYLIQGHCKILYKIVLEKEMIRIITVFDTRQSPDKILL